MMIELVESDEVNQPTLNTFWLLSNTSPCTQRSSERPGPYVVAGASGTQGVDLIEEDDARSRVLSSLEDLSHRPLALPHVLHTHTTTGNTHTSEGSETGQRSGSWCVSAGAASVCVWIRTMLSSSGPFTEMKLSPDSLATACGETPVSHKVTSVDTTEETGLWFSRNDELWGGFGFWVDQMSVCQR